MVECIYPEASHSFGRIGKIDLIGLVPKGAKYLRHVLLDECSNVFAEE